MRQGQQVGFFLKRAASSALRVSSGKPGQVEKAVSTQIGGGGDGKKGQEDSKESKAPRCDIQRTVPKTMM